MKKFLGLLFGLTIAVGGLAAATAQAHHSAASFDMSPKGKKILTGTVRKFEWANPHVWLFLDVRDSGGKVTTWGLEMASPGSLRASNLTFNSIKTGEKITVEVGPKRDGTPNAIVAGPINWADGRVWAARGTASPGGGGEGGGAGAPGDGASGSR